MINFTELFSLFQLIVLVLRHISHLVQSVFPAGSSFHQISSKNPHVHELLSTKQQEDRVRDELVNTVQYLVAKETDIFLSSQ